MLRRLAEDDPPLVEYHKGCGVRCKPQRDPHGEPIPTRNLAVAEVSLLCAGTTPV